MHAKSPYGDAYLDKLYEAFSGLNEAAEARGTALCGCFAVWLLQVMMMQTVVAATAVHTLTRA